MYSTPILLAISGGIDSMVMLHRMRVEFGAENIGVAHCNFQLRGADADADEELVKRACERYGVPYYVQRFDTKEYAAKQKLSIQEAARELRYAFFFQLREMHGYRSIATAHHLDDSIETFFINLLRGTGPKGLAGIKDDGERGLIRPIMDMDRNAILLYASEHGVEWREDTSNASEKYLRNKIRHDLLPLMQELKPGFTGVMRKNMEIQHELAELLGLQAEAYRKNHFKKKGDKVIIQYSGAKEEGLILVNLLSGYGFNATQVHDILQSSQPGRQVFSKKYVITTHQSGLMLSPCKDITEGPWQVFENLRCDHIDIGLSMEVLNEVPALLDQGPNIAFLDTDQLHFPMTVRQWKEGDKLIPLGMSGQKNVSDLLNDIGLSREEKKEVFILESGSEIIWVIGHRIDDRYKVKKESRAVLKVELQSPTNDSSL